MAGFWRGRVRGGAATRKKAIPTRANEDMVLCRAVDATIGVFDGIGAYSHARLASQIARQRSTPLLRAIDRETFGSLEEALAAMSKAILAAQEGVLELQNLYPHAGDGGTTATLAKLWQPEPEKPVMALFANIGDSRLYQWHARERRLERLTNDDNVVRQWQDLGWLDESAVESLTNLLDAYEGKEDLMPIAREAWEQRNTVSAWLGMPDITYSLGATEVSPKDRILATSDGIHDNLTIEAISNIICDEDDPREVAVHLLDVAAAIAYLDESPRAKPDDMSASLLIFDH